MPISRRSWLQSGWLASLLGCAPQTATEPAKPTVYERLGLRPILNFRGTHTTLGASKQWQETFAIQAEAARQYIVLEELQNAQASGDLAETADVEQLANFLTGVLVGLNLFVRVTPSRAAVNAYIQQALACLDNPA